MKNSIFFFDRKDRIIFAKTYAKKVDKSDKRTRKPRVFVPDVV